jgi:hypothetical protein
VCIRTVAAPDAVEPTEDRGHAEARARESSPYHGLPRPRSSPADRLNREVIERVNYPEPPPRPAPLPPRREAVAKLLPIDEPPAVAAKKLDRPVRPPEPVKLPEPAPAPEEPAVGALRCYLQRKPDEAGKLLDSTTADARARCACCRRSRALPGPHDRAGAETFRTCRSYAGLTDPLRRKELPRVDRLTFCRQIQHFGVYDPRRSRGRRSRPAVRAARRDDARLRGSATSPASRGRRTTSRRWPAGRWFATGRTSRSGNTTLHHEDQSRTPRQDYFITYTLCVPCGLAPGDYTLWIEVTDMQSKPVRSARRSLTFPWSAPPPPGGGSSPSPRVAAAAGTKQLTSDRGRELSAE